MLTVPEVAQRYKVSKSTVASWITSGQLPAINVAPAKSRRRFYRISPDSLLDFERSRSQGRPPASPPSRVIEFFK